MKDPDEIDFESDDFADIVAKDPRFAARAYALVMDCIHYLSGETKDEKEVGSHITGEDILEEFRNRTLDQYGPLSLRVLSEWGVTRCEDIGEMMMNLAEAGRVQKEEGDTPESFAGGYSFKEAFQDPYEP